MALKRSLSCVNLIQLMVDKIHSLWSELSSGYYPKLPEIPYLCFLVCVSLLSLLKRGNNTKKEKDIHLIWLAYF